MATAPWELSTAPNSRPVFVLPTITSTNKDTAKPSSNHQLSALELLTSLVLLVLLAQLAVLLVLDLAHAQLA